MGRGINISPAELSESGPAFVLGIVFDVSSAKPRLRSLSAMRLMADLGRVWVSEVDAELRMRNLGVLGVWEMRILGSGHREKMKGKGDWSVRGFEAIEEEEEQVGWR